MTTDSYLPHELALLVTSRAGKAKKGAEMKPVVPLFSRGAALPCSTPIAFSAEADGEVELVIMQRIPPHSFQGNQSSSSGLAEVRNVQFPKSPSL
jgi:hypothetical protein